MDKASLPIFSGETVRYNSEYGTVLYQTVYFPYGLSFELKPTHVKLPFLDDPKKHSSLSYIEYDENTHLNQDVVKIRQSIGLSKRASKLAAAATADDEQKPVSQKPQSPQKQQKGPKITGSNLTPLGKRKAGPSSDDEADAHGDGDTNKETVLEQSGLEKGNSDQEWSEGDSFDSISEVDEDDFEEGSVDHTLAVGDSREENEPQAEALDVKMETDNYLEEEPDLSSTPDQEKGQEIQPSTSGALTTLEQDDENSLFVGESGPAPTQVHGYEVIEIGSSQENEEALFVDSPDEAAPSGDSVQHPYEDQEPQTHIQTDIVDTHQDDPDSVSQSISPQNHASASLDDHERELGEYCEQLQLSNAAQEVALRMFRMARHAPSLKTRSIRSVIAAAIVAGSRHVGKPRQFKEVQSTVHVPYQEIGRTYKLLEPILREDPTFMVGATTLTTLVRRTCIELGYPETVMKAADFIVHKIEENEILAGNTPNTIAACAIYLTCLLINSTADGTGIAKHLDITASELRTNYVTLWDTRAQLVNPAWHMTEKEIERWEVSEAALR